MAWSGCGRFLASVCRDGKVRIFCPRQSRRPLREGGDIVAKKGARVLWACEGRWAKQRQYESESSCIVFYIYTLFQTKQCKSILYLALINFFYNLFDKLDQICISYMPSLFLYTWHSVRRVVLSCIFIHAEESHAYKLEIENQIIGWSTQIYLRWIRLYIIILINLIKV